VHQGPAVPRRAAAGLSAVTPRQWFDPVGVQQLEGGRPSWAAVREVTPARLSRDREGAGCLRRRLLLSTAEGGGAVNLDEIKALGGRLAELCRKYGIAELAVFGSVARGDAGPDSDVDLLYVRVPGNDLGMAYFDLQDDLTPLRPSGRPGGEGRAAPGDPGSGAGRRAGPVCGVRNCTSPT
jgi:hypothetical protein